MSNGKTVKGFIPPFIYQQYKRNQFAGSFDAAVVFIDLVGFTSLTEKFMTHHLEGAESLSEALNSVFAPLVHEVAQRGGTIPLFAGDAFATIFPDQESTADAVRQALQTAVFMQTFFTTNGRYRLIETPQGDIQKNIRSTQTDNWRYDETKRIHSNLYR